ncbi:MAG: AmmeMemoRadiSam system radical SAM enzyme [Candidatus Woesearchaeota archaeon]
MEKEAMYYKQLKDKIVQCQLCPNFCTIKEGMVGSCRVRKNIKGKLYAMTYGKAISTAIEPIEKKPFFHFHPGARAYSIATVGCNLHCLFCQNWEISQASYDELPTKKKSPEEAVEEAIANDSRIIAYTYTEPTIFYEYVLDMAKLAKKRGLLNVTITNGFINPEPLKELYKYIDAANIDLKGFTEEYYKEVCGGRLKPVLDAIVNIKKMGVFVEITNLIVTGKNDGNIIEMCKWIKDNVGESCPLHFSRFFPIYKLSALEPTPVETLRKAYDTAKAVGLKYVYMGNVGDEESTYCPKCNALLVKRLGFSVIENKIKNHCCYNCKEKIEGAW